MKELISIGTAAELEALSARGGVALLGRDELLGHTPDGHWVLLADGGAPVARCSLWWRKVPQLEGERTGIIGHFAALDGASAAVLLNHCCRELAGQGCSVVIGPMDGNSWRRYRFITSRGSEPPFFLEPDNPDQYPGYFETAGFAPLARYYSNLDPDLGWEVAEPLKARLSRRGVRIRPLEPDDFAAELERIYTISVAAFTSNFLYSPISRDEFMAMYTRVQNVVQPELVLFAEHQHQPVGFVFAIADLLHVRPTGGSDTMIIKSLAVLPEWNGKGIGPLLMAAVTANARTLGYQRGIHALMHESNRSRGLSGHHGAMIREYTLYCRGLG
jgi:L-amino acid N-acyltransferase YncA